MATMLIRPLILTETASKKPSHVQKDGSSRFMRLPLSIRRIIYGYALISEETIEIHELTRRNSVTAHRNSISSRRDSVSSHRNSMSKHRPSISSPSPVEPPSNLPRVSLLLQTCSQIRKEAAPIYYGLNIFVLPWGFPGLGCRWLYV